MKQGTIQIDCGIDCGDETCDNCSEVMHNYCVFFNEKLINVTSINIMDNPGEHNDTYLRLPKCLETFKEIKDEDNI